MQFRRRPSKYKNIRTEIDGNIFSSRAEANRYAELKLLYTNGNIKDLSLQPHFTLLPPFTDSHQDKHRRMEYVADFQYVETEGKDASKVIVEDVKGFKTAEYALKKKLFLFSIRNKKNIVFREIS